MATRLLLTVLLAVACETRPSMRSAGTSGTESATAAPTNSAPADSGPASVIHRYYEAIDAKRYTDAWRLWSQGGAASGKTVDEFKAGFASTARVAVTAADSISIEGAAGSQYATVGVVVDATQMNGDVQRFTGTYTLRRAMVDGARPEQRAWRIYSAKLSGR
jgi:hypothetical protein